MRRQIATVSLTKCHWWCSKFVPKISIIPSCCTSPWWSTCTWIRGIWPNISTNISWEPCVSIASCACNITQIWRIFRKWSNTLWTIIRLPIITLVFPTVDWTKSIPAIYIDDEKAYKCHNWTYKDLPNRHLHQINL